MNPINIRLTSDILNQIIAHGPKNHEPHPINKLYGLSHLEWLHEAMQD